MKRFLLILACVSLLALDVSSDDPTPDVPLSHRIYQTIDRYEAWGWFAEPAPGARPYTRRRAARFLLEILRRADAGASLSQTERGVLDRHWAEFSAELGRLGYPPSPSPRQGVVGRLFGGDNLFAWQDSVASVAIDPLFRQRLLLVRGEGRAEETVSQTYVGGIVRGTYYNRFGFRVRHFEAREWSTRPRISRQDIIARPIEVVQFKGKAVDFREASFQLIWATPWFDLDIGKRSLDWGPGRSGNLLLTDNASPFGLVRLRASYGRVNLVHVVGFLRARAGLIDSSRTRIDNGHLRTFLRSKYMSAHRVEIRLSGRLSIGLQEAVVYGDRGPEFLYLPPVTVLTAAQTTLGDKDNLAVGLDLSARIARNLKTYSAIFFDDLKKFSPGAFSNKFALQIGFLWVDPFGLRDTDLRAEYIRLEPFVYSHKFDINTYQHFDALLGYPLGPNSDRIFGQVVHCFSPSFSLSLMLDRERQGANILNPDGSLVNVGGDAEQGRRPSDPVIKRFMDGIRETRTRLGAGLMYEPIRDFVFTLDYRTTAAGNVRLPGGNRGDARTHLWTMTMDVNFF